MESLLHQSSTFSIEQSESGHAQSEDQGGEDTK